MSPVPAPEPPATPQDASKTPDALALGILPTPAVTDTVHPFIVVKVGLSSKTIFVTFVNGII
jgi:hypothetical protein